MGIRVFAISQKRMRNFFLASLRRNFPLFHIGLFPYHFVKSSSERFRNIVKNYVYQLKNTEKRIKKRKEKISVLYFSTFAEYIKIKHYQMKGFVITLKGNIIFNRNFIFIFPFNIPKWFYVWRTFG